MQLNHFAAAVLGASFMGAMACSTPTTISDAWRDPNYTAAPMRKILVLGRTDTETTRRSLEDAFTAALDRHGVQAVASYHVFPGREPDREAIKSYLENQRYDGALVTEFLGVQTQTSLVPSADFYSYYGGPWATGYAVETDQFVRVETSLWDPHTGKLVWSATSQTENPRSSQDATASVVKKIVSSLTSAGLVPGLAVSSTTTSRHAY